MFEYELIISISTEFPNQEIPKDVLIVQLLQHFSTCTSNQTVFRPDLSASYTSVFSF